MYWGVTLTIIYTAVANYFGKGPNVSGGLQSFDFQTLVIKALTYKYNYSWADILMMYIPFLILAPLLLQAFKSRLSFLVLGISALLWASNLGKSSCDTFCVSFFEVTSWQFLFILGMFVAFKKDFFANLYQHVFSNVYLKGLVFIAFILTVIASVYDVFFQGFTGSTKEIMNILINKENIGAGRILVFGLWMCVYYFLIQKYIDKFPKLLRFIYEELGKNSLTTYVIQSIVLFVFYYFPLRYSFWPNNLYQVLALSSVVLLLLGFKKIQNRSKNITK